jgi:hypothetical protein
MKRSFDNQEVKNQKQDKRPRLPKCQTCKAEVGELQGVSCSAVENTHFNCFSCTTRRVEPIHDGKDFKLPAEVPCFKSACNAVVSLNPNASIEKPCPKCTTLNRNEFRLNINCISCEHSYCSLCKLPETHNGFSCCDRADVTWRAIRLQQLLAVKCPAKYCTHAYAKDGPGNDMQCFCGQRFAANTGEPYVDAQLYFCQRSWEQPCYSEDCKARGHLLIRDPDHDFNAVIRNQQASEKVESELKDRRNIPLLILAQRQGTANKFTKLADVLMMNIFKFSISKNF